MQASPKLPPQPTSPTSHPASADKKSFWWQVYLDHLHQSGVRTAQLPWFRRRVEQLLDRHPNCRSLDLSAADIDQFLIDLGGLHLSDWQMLQSVDAVRRFGQYIHARWAEEVDWRRWEAQWRGDVVASVAGMNPSISSGDLYGSSPIPCAS